MNAEYRSWSSRAPLPAENIVESMRASKSSIQRRILFFHSVGKMLRTGASGQFQIAQPPGWARRAVMRECCGKPKALLRRWGLAPYLTERGSQTNGLALDFDGTANAVRGFLSRRGTHLRADRCNP